MSFTNKDGSLKSKVYESLTRRARRERTGWKKEWSVALKTYNSIPEIEVLYTAEYDMQVSSEMASYWDGYKTAVYDTLKKLTELEDVELKVWEESVDAIYKDWEEGAFDWTPTGPLHVIDLR